MRKEGETGFIWYSSWDEGFDAIVKNAPELALKLYEAIRKYGIKGEDTELDWQAIGLFSQIKGDIDRAKERYEDTVEAGKKGGAKTIYDVEKAKQMVLEGATTDEIMEEIGCSKRCAQYYKAEFSSKNTENESDNDTNAIECNESAIGAMGCNDNDASAISAISAIRCNNLDKDIEKEIEKDKDTEKDKEKEIEREKEKENVSFPPNFCHEIYKLYQNAGLPLPKTGEIGFMQYDMKVGMKRFQEQGISPPDVLEAVKNYIRVISLGENTWYNAKLSFDELMKQSNLMRFIPDRFDIVKYTDRKVLAFDAYDGRPW